MPPRKTRIVSTMSASAQDRYLQFLKTQPSLATRVPQGMLASYLGISPETVSRIRRKLMVTQSGKTANTITARLDNATDVLYRNHLNYLKDLAPEMGRNVRIVYSVKF